MLVMSITTFDLTRNPGSSALVQPKAQCIRPPSNCLTLTHRPIPQDIPLVVRDRHPSQQDTARQWKTTMVCTMAGVVLVEDIGYDLKLPITKFTIG